MRLLTFMRSSWVNKGLLNLAAAVAVAGLSACEGSDQQTLSNRADWLRSYVSTHSIQRGWVVTNISVENDSRIAMDISVPKSKVRAIISLSRMQQVAIAKRLCPSDKSGVLRVFSGKGRFWIYLNGRNGRIIGGSCKYNSQG